MNDFETIGDIIDYGGDASYSLGQFGSVQEFEDSLLLNDDNGDIGDDSSDIVNYLEFITENETVNLETIHHDLSLLGIMLMFFIALTAGHNLVNRLRNL